MADRRISPRYFDNTRTLLSTRYQTVSGESLRPGAPISDELPHGTRMKLWLSRRAAYEADFSPTPVEAPDTSWMALSAGWLVAPGDEDVYLMVPESVLDENEELPDPAPEDLEEVEGFEAARERVEELRAEAALGDVKIEKGTGGWYTITAPWLDEPLKVRGEEAAKAKQAEIAEAGAPEGWVDPASEPELTIVLGSIVTQTAEDATLYGRKATVQAFEGENAIVTWIEVEGGAEVTVETTIPVADLILYTEPQDSEQTSGDADPAADPSASAETQQGSDEAPADNEGA